MTQKIWEAVLDDTWNCEVSRIDESTGTLTVTNGQVVILDETVTLSYGAAFGPDIADVSDWEDRCVFAVDQYER